MWCRYICLRCESVSPTSFRSPSISCASWPRQRLAPDAAARLIRHAWPGNVRELKNAIERAAVLVRGDMVNSADLGFIDENEQQPREQSNGLMKICRRPPPGSRKC